VAAIDPFGGPDEEDLDELYPDPLADDPPFANYEIRDDDTE
jgi:hypothetical protein